jgi:hypothetical protein
VGYRKLSFAVRRGRIAIHEFDLFAPLRLTEFVVAGGAIQPSQKLDLLKGATAKSETTKRSRIVPSDLDCFARLAIGPLGITGITKHFRHAGGCSALS